MSAPAALKGTFSDFKLIRGRKVAQLVIEVPLEQADAALQALGGLPNPADERWVAVARLDLQAKQEEPKQLPAPERQSWDMMPLAKQAAIRGQDPEFQRFLGETVCAPRGWEKPADEQEAAQVIRAICGIESRADLRTRADAAERWLGLDGDFFAWQRGAR